MIPHEFEPGSLDSYDASRFASICAISTELNLSEAVRLGVQSACNRLVCINLSRDDMKSPTQIANEMKQLATALNKCINLFHEISPINMGEIDILMQDSGELWASISKLPSDEFERFFNPHIAGVLATLKQTAIVLEQAASQRPSAGRKPMLPMYGGVVLEVAYHLKEAKIGIARGGEFQRICEAVWKDAGMASNAEGAIRYALDEMQDEYSMYALDAARF